MKYKYGLKPSDAGYHRMVARTTSVKRNRIKQIKRWEELLDVVLKLEMKGLSYREIAEYIADKTNYKLRRMK